MTAVSRRHLAKGAAWPVPAVVIAAAAPSLAASGSSSPGDGGPGTTPPAVVEGLSLADKCQGKSQVPGGWPKQGYRLELTVSPVTAPTPTISSITLSNGTPGEVPAVTPVQLRPGVWEYVVKAASSPSTLTVVYTVGAGPVQTARVHASPHCGR